MSDWIEVGTLDDFEDDDVFGAHVSGTPVAVYLVDGQVFATHDICSHGHARLSEGFVEDGLIECPLHQGLFDIRTGAPAGAPCTEPITVFEARLEDRRILVSLTPVA
ncbi:MAG: non-heme iron oxygenase ferredoxin subunit [Pseudomonadota bacterium]